MPAAMFSRESSDDWELLTEGREIALATLFERHKDYVYRLAWGFLGDPELAQDATQDVFLRMAQGRRRWRPRAKFRTWLYQVTLNTCREFRRRRKRDAHPQLPGEIEEVSAAELPHQKVLLSQLSRTLGGLSERQREVVVLRFYEGLSTRETAQVMGCREGTVKTHLHRALEILRQRMEMQENVPRPPPRSAQDQRFGMQD